MAQTAPLLTPSPTEEAALGLAFYLTGTPGTGGRIKEEPEDFVVVERTKWPREDPAGPYLALEVRARNWETNRLAARLGRSLFLSRTRVTFAGTKDKRAVTTQGFTVRLDGEPTRDIRLPEVEVFRSFRATRALGLGDLENNAFEIAITGVDGTAETAAALAGDALKQAAAQGGFPNYFGTQRFGSLRPVTHRVGAALIAGDYAGAVREYVGTPSPFESADARAFRRAFLEGADDPKALLPRVPPRLSFERQMLEALVGAPDDPMAAVLRLPRNLVLMFIHAHQSELFNRMLSERLRRGLPLARPLIGDLVVPLEARGSAIEDQPAAVTEANLAKVTRQIAQGRAAVTGLVPGAEAAFAGGEMGEVERHVLDQAGRRANDFVLPDMPRFTTKGVRRPIHMTAAGARVEPASLRGRPAVRLAFDLPRGCYATVVLREVIKRPESAWASADLTAAASSDLA